MANKDLRDWISGVAAAGELKTIRGAERKDGGGHVDPVARERLQDLDRFVVAWIVANEPDGSVDERGVEGVLRGLQLGHRGETLLGVAGYNLGKQAHRLLGTAGVIILVVATILLVVGFIAIRRNEHRLEEEAERVFPGPLAHHIGKHRGKR